MKIILLVLILVSFSTISDVYQCIIEGVTSFTDKPCEDEINKKPLYVIPEYITFKWGGTACEDIKYWKISLDLIENKSDLPFKEADKYCKSLRENTVVLGILEKQTYKNTELGKIKASNGKTYWVELKGVQPITSKTNKKPIYWQTDLREQNGERVIR
ncbi:hypothetical protein [Pseudoalteromonas sp.]|uniref:hypothetical protein n=1 Tax=Pseudoalteromonas sp. TaxID=53249 RepID=UPI0023560AEE|nr:hypothetical protein [Pseudoalteromonas sp.]